MRAILWATSMSNLNNYEAAAQVYEDTLEVKSHNLYALNHLGLAYKAN